MAPPITSASTLLARFSSRLILVETFAPPTSAITGRRGLPSPARSAFELGLHGAAGGGGQQPRDAFGRGMGAMGGGEGVVDVDVAKARHALGELLVVLLLARMEAGVLEHDDRARRARP